MRRVVTVIFVILLTFTLIELSLLLYFSFKPKNKITGVTKEKDVAIITAFPENKALYGPMLKVLELIDRGVLTSSTLVNRFEGRIKEIDRQSGSLPRENFQYHLRIVLESSDDRNYSAYFSREETQKIKVIKNNLGIEYNYENDSLNVNDRVVYQVTYDLTKDFTSNLIGAKFIIYEK